MCVIFTFHVYASKLQQKLTYERCLDPSLWNGLQEAHEAIRPAAPEGRFLHPTETDLDGLHLKLYELVYARTMASVMTDAVLDYTTAVLNAAAQVYIHCTNTNELAMLSTVVRVLAKCVHC
eukprot:14927-Heterococcus_DN1.PRE.5